jgi:hypothetical protein
MLQKLVVDGRREFLFSPCRFDQEQKGAALSEKSLVRVANTRFRRRPRSQTTRAATKSTSTTTTYCNRIGYNIPKSATASVTVREL